MQWPQFELWRLFAATALFAGAAAAYTGPDGMFALTIVLFAAGLGTPFKKGIVFAVLASPVGIFLSMLLVPLLFLVEFLFLP